MSYIESADEIFIKIKNTGLLNKGQLEFLNYLYRFGPCTTNELIEKVEKERTDLDRNALDLFDRKPSELTALKVIEVQESRKCKVTNRMARVLQVSNIVPSESVKIAGKAKQILDGSMNSALLAVEIYNKPRSTFKSEAYISLMIMAWTKLFHAYFRGTIGDSYYYVKDEQPIYLDKEKTIKKLWDISTCINKFGRLKEDVRKNIEFFIPLRNKIEHAHIDSKELDAVIFGECQSLLMNYESFLIENFGEKYSINECLVYSLQFSQMRMKEQELANKSILLPQIKDLYSYIETYRKGLPDSILSSQEYRIKIHLVPVVSNSSAADLPVQFIKLKPGETIDGKNLTAIIKDKVIEKEVVGRGTLLHTDVVDRVNERLGEKVLTSHVLNAFNFTFSIKPFALDAKEEDDTNRDYCEYHHRFKRYQFTREYVDIICESLISGHITINEVLEKFKLRKKLDIAIMKYGIT